MELNHFQQYWLDEIYKNQKLYLDLPRQRGISTLFVIISLMEASFYNKDVLLISSNHRMSQHLRRMVSRFNITVPIFKFDKTFIEFRAGGTVFFKTLNQFPNVLCGKRFDMVFIDNPPPTFDMRNLTSSIIPTFSTVGYKFVIATTGYSLPDDQIDGFNINRKPKTFLKTSSSD